MDNDVPDQTVDIDGCRIEHKYRTSRAGGVAVYLRDHLSYNVRRHIIDYGLELICVEIRPLKCRPFIIVAWHRPPRDPISSFDLLEKVLSILDRKTRKLFLLEIKIVFFRKELLIVT